MALANLEAGKLKHSYLAPGHIMLGLIAEGASVATAALRVLDVDLEHVRDQIAEEMGTGDETAAQTSRVHTKATREVIARAIDEARRFQHRYVGTEHLILPLCQQEDSAPAKILKESGVELELLREKVLAMLKSGVDPAHDLAHSRHGHFEWVHQQELAKAFRSQKFWHTMILAVDAANRLGDGEVEPKHLLLALLRDEQDELAAALKEKGITASWVREKIANGNH